MKSSLNPRGSQPPPVGGAVEPAGIIADRVLRAAGLVRHDAASILCRLCRRRPPPGNDVGGGKSKKMAPDTPIRLTVLTPRARLFHGPGKPCRASTKIAQSTTGRIVHLPGTGNEAAVSTVNTVSEDADCNDARRACPGAAGRHC
ncbi:hypothetical protein [Burkholderia pseudomultivorans]|uniref:hypothetical protein n=1 Tax=Burkholderia pseudomultivorans TaxID=1207504 RepID=UPI0012D8D0BF|nr:hypothetical protein [Burkholderia pseudomultivorans]